MGVYLYANESHAVTMMRSNGYLSMCSGDQDFKMLVNHIKIFKSRLKLV